MAESPIQVILESTGLPADIWGDQPKFPRSGKIVRFRDKSDWEGSTYGGFESSQYYDRIPIHSRVISDLTRLPAAHVLGQVALIRTVGGLTAMVSIAEAARLLLDEAQSDLLWFIVHEIERQLRADATDGKDGYVSIDGDVEIPEAEHLARERRKEEILIRNKLKEEREKLEEERERLAQEKAILRLEKPVLERQKDSPWRRENELGSSAWGLLSKEVEKGKDKNRKRADASESSALEILTKEVEKGKEENKSLQLQLKGIREQNDEILRLLKGLHERDDRQRKDPPKKYYENYTFLFAARKNDGQWFLFAKTARMFATDIKFLIDWLEVALGGSGFESSVSSTLFSGCIKLRDENQSLFSEDATQTHGCWRKKILSGNILAVPRSTTGVPLIKPTITLQSENPVQGVPNKDLGDGLLLSAAALWSLFDNSLQRIPSCGCTFKAGSNEYIQCKGFLEGSQLLLWHTFSNTQPCNGNDCEINQRVALTAGERGVRLFSTSPCVLGWTGNSRTKPSSPLWKTLSVTDDFKKRGSAKYEVTEVQAQAHLSIPSIVTPRIAGGITFSTRNYEIANTIDTESIIAMGKCAELVVLIYDESKRLHLACDGADLIEIMCMHSLREMGKDTSSLPKFSYNNALLRLPTWYQSVFVSPMGTRYTGDHLIREASKTISKLVDFATRAAKKDSELLYWLLEDVLCGSGSAKKAPKSKTDVSWYELAFKKPPLILAIGELDDALLTLKNDCIQWLPSPTRDKKLLFNFSGIFKHQPSPGAIVSTERNMRRWLLQARPFYGATLERTDDSVKVGLGPSEPTYRVVESSHSGDDSGIVFMSCDDCKKTSEDSTKRCLHYIQ
jgi:hypothetical protein